MSASEPIPQQLPTHCPICDIELAIDFQCGSYIVLVCGKCGLNIRSFASEPIAAFYDCDGGDGEKSIDLAALLAAKIDREPRKVEIPQFDLDSLGSDLD